MKKISLEEAEKDVDALWDAVQDESITIEKDGKPLGVAMSIEEFEKYQIFMQERNKKIY